MREETGLKLSSCASIHSFNKHELSPTTCQPLHQAPENNTEMKTRRSLPLKNLQTHRVLFHVVSAVTEIPQGLMGAQRKGHTLSWGRSGKAFQRSDALPVATGASGTVSSPRKGVHLGIRVSMEFSREARKAV